MKTSSELTPHLKASQNDQQRSSISHQQSFEGQEVRRQSSTSTQSLDVIQSLSRARLSDQLDARATEQARSSISRRQSFEGQSTLEALRQSSGGAHAPDIAPSLSRSRSSDQLEARTSTSESKSPESPIRHRELWDKTASLTPVLENKSPESPIRHRELWDKTASPTPVLEDKSLEDHTSYKLETLPRDSMGERGSNQIEAPHASLEALDIPAEYVPIIINVLPAEYVPIIINALENRVDKNELMRRLGKITTQIEGNTTQISQESNQINTRDLQISRESDQVSTRDVDIRTDPETVLKAEILIKALGIRNDDLSSSNYLEAMEHAKTMVVVIRTDGHDKEFNDASKELLKLTPKRSRLRSLVNPTKDIVDWYAASWRNQHKMSKLDTTTWGGYLNKAFYQVNQPIVGLTNTRSGNLGFIGFQAVAATGYTWYIEKKFPIPTLGVNLENSAIARIVYTKLPPPINQIFDTFQFQGFGISLEAVKEVLTRNATMGG